ncbi:unnamed protein product [Absidia cylindrospora]
MMTNFFDCFDRTMTDWNINRWLKRKFVELLAMIASRLTYTHSKYRLMSKITADIHENIVTLKISDCTVQQCGGGNNVVTNDLA